MPLWHIIRMEGQNMSTRNDIKTYVVSLCAETFTTERRVMARLNDDEIIAKIAGGAAAVFICTTLVKHRKVLRIPAIFIGIGYTYSTSRYIQAMIRRMIIDYDLRRNHISGTWTDDVRR